METKIAQFTCSSCATVSEYTARILDGKERFKPSLCCGCIDEERKRREEEATAARQAELEDSWRRICPASYRMTDPNFPMMNQALLSGLMQYEPKGDGRGIGLHGPTGNLKTRMMFLVLKKLHFEGRKVFAISAKRLAKCYSIMYGSDRECDAARHVIRRSYTADVLFLDDIGKERFTEHGQAEFYELVERRTSTLRPILWTANATGAELAAMMSIDRGWPIVRRLEEFCEVVGVGDD